MRISGRLPEDAPDPRLRLVEQLRAMPVPILGLVPQPNVEDWGAFGMSSGISNGVMHQMTVSIGYTLWRNPADRDDPGNLAELDEEARRAVELQTPWPRPSWLLETVARMRYPMLWEAVRTSWHAAGAHRQSPAAELVHHVDHVLRNHYADRSARDPAARLGAWEPSVDERHVEHGVPVVVNGTAVAGMRIDTDPHVLGLGADLGEAGVLTAVLDRDALPYLVPEFAARALDA